MSVTITAADINKLRQTTGAGMLDCRKALTESNGDFEAAIDWLRKQGQKVAAKRSDREAKEGVIIAQTTADNKSGIILCISARQIRTKTIAATQKRAQKQKQHVLNQKPMAVMTGTSVVAAEVLLLNLSGVLRALARVAEGLQVVVVEDRDKAPRPVLSEVEGKGELWRRFE